MKAQVIVDRMLEAGPDDVAAKDYLRALPAQRPERWVFSESEIFTPENCKGTDELVATITVKEHEEDEDDDDWLVHIIVLRNGTVTERFARAPGWTPPPELAAVVNFDAPVPEDLRQLADAQEVLYSPAAEDMAVHWRSVFADETGQFVRWNRE